MKEFENVSTNFQESIDTINSINNTADLKDLRKKLSFVMQKNPNNPDYLLIKSTIDYRLNELEEEIRRARADQSKRGSNKVLTMSPTSVSNRSGIISATLIFAGIAVTAAMYTILYLTALIK